MFTFSTHPAAIDISEGIQAAFSYLQTSWRRWLPIVVAGAVLTGVLYALIGSSGTSNLYYVNRSTNEIVWYPDAANRLWGIVAVGLASTAVSVVSSWIFAAAAIAGLRNRPMTASFVVVRGLVTVVASMVIAIVAIGAVLALVVMVVAAPPLGLLLVFAAIPVSVYLWIRVIFYTLAIFDGCGPIEGISEAWRLSRKAVLRLFGWGLMAFLISIGFAVCSAIVGAVFSSSRLMPVGQALSGLVTITGSCYTVFLMAVLYESERARHDPATYGYAAGSGYPPSYPGGPYPYGPGPYPYAPGPYPAGPAPYAPAPYPGAPAWPGTSGAYPGGQPMYPGAYPGAPAPYPSFPTPYPGGPAWPGAPAPYPGGPGPDPGASGWPGQGAAPGSSGDAGPGNLPYQGAAPSYPGSPAERWQPPVAPQTPGPGSDPGPAWKSGDTDEPAPPADPPPSA